MEDGGIKVRENRLRRWAARLGLEFRKSRARKIHVHDLGAYQVVDPEGDRVVSGDRFELSLADVEAVLEKREAELVAESRTQGGDQ